MARRCAAAVHAGGLGLLVALAAAGCSDSAQPAGPADAATTEARAADAGDASDALVSALDSDAVGVCEAPLRFEPPGSPAGFRHTDTKLLVVTQGPPNHRGQDVVAREGEPQRLIGKFAYGIFDADLKDEDVEIYIQPQPPCGPWALLATQRTSEEGEHGSRYGIEDDGGRIFFEIPADRARPAGRYPVRMLVVGDHSMAKLTLFVLRPGTSTVVFDIDGTLTTDDFQLVSQLFSELLSGSYVPKMYQGAPQVVQAWAAKGYLPVYLTARPDFLGAISRRWLVDQGLAPGAVHLTDTSSQALPTNTAGYKADFLARLSQTGGAALHAGYGNAVTDIEAYAAAAIPKERTFIIGAHGGEQGTVAIDAYPAHLAAASAMPQAAVSAPEATFGW